MKTIAKTLVLSSLSLLATTLFSQQAFAQTSTENKEQAVSVIGFGAGYVPEYEGAQKRRAIPVLFGEYRNSNGFFVSSMKGIGLEKQAGDVEVSAALSYRGGRRDNRSNSSLFGSDDLKGMGDIPGSAVASLEASTLLAGTVKIHGSANLALNHRDNGNSFKFGVSRLIYQTNTDQVGLDFSTEFADRKFNQTYFGVTAQQSQNSGYRPYKLKNGFNQMNASVAWNHVIDQHWSVRTMLGVTQLTDEAANSPIAKNKTNPVLISTVNYRF